MVAPPNPSIADSPPEALADVREAMSRRGDFDPSVESYANQSNFFEVLAALEALEVEGVALA